MRNSFLSWIVLGAAALALSPNLAAQVVQQVELLEKNGPGGPAPKHDVFGQWAGARGGARGLEAPALTPAGQARFDGPERHIEDFRDFLVGIILQIKQGHRRLVNLVHLRERGDDLFRVETVDGVGRNDGEIRRGLVQFHMGESGLPPPRVATAVKSEVWNQPRC